MNNTIPEEQIDYYAAYMGLHREMEKVLQENTQLRLGSAPVSAASSPEPHADTAASSYPVGSAAVPAASSSLTASAPVSATSPPASLDGSVPVRFSPPPGDLPELPTPTDIIQWAIIKAGIDLINLLLEKNRHYGASVFFPMHTFARASWREAIYVRLDDKLARLRSGQADDKEDPSTDIAGYLVLEKSGRLLEEHGVIPAEAAAPSPKMVDVFSLLSGADPITPAPSA